MLFAIIKNNIHIGNIKSTCHQLAILEYLFSANLNTQNIHKYNSIIAIKGVHFN
jgi:hypothetical protein